MSKQIINTGSTPSDGTGDSIRAAFGKVNANFTELYDGQAGKADATALAAEILTRQNADSTLQGHIDAEASTRAAAVASKADASALTAETAARIAADATKADLVNGKVPSSQIPAIAISSYLGSVSSQTAMLALSGQSGDWCNRSDTSTAWVITGDDPTQLASWAQINYPASPVTEVNGQTGVVNLGKGNVGLALVDNTPDAQKPVSTPQQTALDLKQDKSTLGASTATAVHSATSKTTPVDADEIPLADSAATFGLKKLTWANLKATLKTYTDTLYAALTHASRHKSGGADAIKIDELAAGTTGGTALDASTTTHGLMSSADKTKLNGISNGANNYSLPVAGSSTLGGVKANAGSTGQFVKGINTSDGSLIFDTPAGGSGGGAALVAGAGNLQGNTVPGTSATGAGGYLDMGSWTPLSEGTIRIANYQYDITFTLANVDPANGTQWIDTNSSTTGDQVVFNISSYLSGSAGSINVEGTSGGRMDLRDVYDTGPTSWLTVTSTLPEATYSGTTYGESEMPGSGAVTTVVLVAWAAGKTTFPLRCAWNLASSIPGCYLQFALRRHSTGELLALTGGTIDVASVPVGEVSNAMAGGQGAVASAFSPWVNGCLEADLVAYYGESPPDGGEIGVWAQALQQ